MPHLHRLGITDGACGYGDPDIVGVKSSTRAKKVDSLEGLQVSSIACGFAHTVAVVSIERKSVEGTVPAAVAKSAAKAKKQENVGTLDGLPELRNYEIERKKGAYRGATAWILFMKAERAKIKAEEQAAGKGKGVDEKTGKKRPRGMSFAALGEEIGQRWRALSEKEREEWYAN